MLGLVGVWQGTELIPTLRHGFVLMAVPAFVARASAVLCLGCGVALLALALRLTDQPDASKSGAVAAMLLALTLTGCGAMSRSATTSGLPPALVAQARPIGTGARFHPPATGCVTGPCSRRLGRRVGVHVELFAANRVVIVPAGIGTRAPRTFSSGRIASARCYGGVVTLEPTGLVLVRPAPRIIRLSELFSAWGQALSPRRLGPFAAPSKTRVAVFVDGRPSSASPRSVPLAAHAEIVLEVGPHVPPHSSYTFPAGT